MNKNYIYMGIAFLGGGAVGSVITYVAMRQKLINDAQQEIADGIADELVKTRQFYDEKYRHEEAEDVQSIADELGFEEEVEVTTVTTIIEDEGYASSDDDIPHDPNVPYIITKEQFDDDTEYDKTLVTYYEEDNTLVDDDNQIIPDIDSTVGRAIHKFGHKSGDSNLVYVRNEQIELDFEVVLNESSYLKEVLNIDVSESDGRVKKMRDDD